MTSWIYISGRGHSGSTMLDIMLGNASDIQSVGELVAGMGRYEAKCSCGEKFKNCSYWRDVRIRFEERAGASWDDAVQESLRQAHISRLPATILATSETKWVKRLRRYCEHIADSLSQSQQKRIVDSSKEITRAIFLLRFVPESRVIHLIRHPVNVLQSDYRRLNKGSGLNYLRKRLQPRRWYGPYLLLSASSWLAGNLLVEAIRMIHPDKYLRIHYEDLIRQPIEEVEKIEKFIDVSLDEIKRKIKEQEPFKISHNIGGNHMRMKGSFVLDPKKAHRSGLPKRYAILANIICWPLLLLYGYSWRKIQ